MSHTLENGDVYKRVNHTRIVFTAVVEAANLGKPNTAVAQRIIQYINTEYTEDNEFIPASLAARLMANEVTPYHRRSVNRMLYAVRMAGGNTVDSRGVAYPPKDMKYAHIKARYIKGIMQGLTVSDIEELANPVVKHVVEVSEDYAVEEHELYI